MTQITVEARDLRVGDVILNHGTVKVIRLLSQCVVTTLPDGTGPSWGYEEQLIIERRETGGCPPKINLSRT